MRSSPHKYIGLDWGAARIGVAVSLDGQLCFPREHIEHTDFSGVVSSLIQLINDVQADTLVLGLPKNMKGEETAMAREVRDVGERLKQETGCAIIYEDERLTSQFAQSKRVFDSQKASDSIAALALLENYLARL